MYPHRAPGWGPRGQSRPFRERTWGRGRVGAELNAKSGLQVPSSLPPSRPPAGCPDVTRPRRSYLGMAQKHAAGSAQGQAPTLELRARHRRHCHAGGAGSDPRQQQRARRKLYVAAGICLIFMVGEAVGERVLGERIALHGPSCSDLCNGAGFRALQ